MEKLLTANKVGDVDVQVAGKSYFISDGSPLENFEFLRPLCESRGKKFPTLIIPTNIMLVIALLCEHLHIFLLTSFGVHVEPFLTRAEVYKVGVTHHFSIDRAKRDLGYKPKITSSEGARLLADYYGARASLAEGRNWFEVAGAIWWVLVLSGMASLGLVAFWEDPDLPAWLGLLLSPQRWLALRIFGSTENLQSLFVFAVGLHTLEATLAVSLARFAKLNTWWLWGLQTWILGYPSFRLLLKWLDISKKGSTKMGKGGKDK